MRIKTFISKATETDKAPEGAIEKFINGVGMTAAFVTALATFATPFAMILGGAIWGGAAAAGAAAASGLGVQVLAGAGGAMGGLLGGTVAATIFGEGLKTIFKKKDPSYGLLEALSSPAAYAEKAVHLALSPLLLLKAKSAFSKAAAKKEDPAAVAKPASKVAESAPKP